MYKKYFKRIFDLIIAISCLPFFIIIAIPVAILIKLDSRGSIFFTQKRAGKNGDYFKILKFRTMHSSPEHEKKGFEPGTQKRVTRVGRILRKTKLDETPQIINVLLGDMSIVGPRPEVEKYINIYPDQWQKILTTRPGITDPASVKFRNEEEILATAEDPEKEYIEKILPAKLELYNKYLDEISLLNDVKIIFQTIFCIFSK